MSFSLRWMCVFLLAFSVVLAGMGATHASGHKSGDRHHHSQDSQNYISVKAHGSGFQGSPEHQKSECHEVANETSKAPASQHDEISGCCHNVTSSSFAMRDASDHAILDFEVKGFSPHRDRSLSTYMPESQPKPPRILA
ncbi:MAG: hypothetical protein RIA64_14655 [Rhodospirillales bacterium]